MRRASWRLASSVAVAMLLLGCAAGTGIEDRGVMTSPTPSTEPGTAEPQARDDGRLTIGTVLPETGQAAFLGEPQIAGVRLAVEDVNAAGGVLGWPLHLVEADSGTDPDTALRAVDRLHSAGVDAIVGAATSAVSGAIIPALTERSTVQCSASNTSPQLLSSVTGAYFFRTVADDEAAAPVIAQRVTASGAGKVVIVARADEYGAGLALPLRRAFEADPEMDVAPTINYDPEAEGFETEVEQVTAEQPDAVVVVGYSETGKLLRRLIDAGVDADAIFGADGLFSPDLPVLVGAGEGAIDGLTVIGASGDRHFNLDRLDPVLSGKGNFIYGAQAYDCVMTIALAALSAGSDRPTDFADRIAAVTRDGTTCASFVECRDFLEQGHDIDYDGPSGPIDLHSQGDGSLGSPRATRYAIASFMDGGRLVQVDARDQEVSSTGS